MPTVLVAIFASLLFQSGLEFWFSNRARGMLENTVQVAQGAYRYEIAQVGDEATTMAGDVAGYLQQVPIDDPRFQQAFGASRSISDLSTKRPSCTLGPDKQIQTLAAGQRL